jgi:hypothetical protein
MKVLFVILLASLLMAACSQSGWVKQDTASRYYLPPIGTLVELQRPLTVPPGRARVFLQGGQVTQGFDQYQPNCNFEIRTLSEQPQVISPEKFLVVKVQRVTEEVVQTAEPIQVAWLGLVGRDTGGYTMIVRGVHLWLGSDTQPDVMRLTCRGGFDDPWRVDPPSIDEMRAALGDYAHISLPYEGIVR